MAVEYDDLKMSMSEFFELPICVREFVLENQKEITEAKSARINKLGSLK